MDYFEDQLLKILLSLQSFRLVQLEVAEMGELRQLLAD
jgi:hypothetical protein